MSQQSFRAYLVAAGVVLLGVIPTLLFQAYEGDNPPLTAFVVSVMFAAWYGGIRPGLFATVLSIVASMAILSIGPPNFEADVVRVVIFTGVALSVGLMAGSLRDTREALRREYAKLGAVMDQFPVAVVIADTQGKVIRSNPMVKEILRHDARASVAEATWTALEPDGRVIPPSEYSTARALRGELVVDREYRYVRGDETGTWIRASSAPIYDEGRIVGAVSLFTDIGEEREARERLRRAEQALELALEAARMGHWHLDLRTQALDASAQCRANFGWPEDSPLAYHDIVAAIHVDDRAAMQAAVRDAVEGRRPYFAEYRVAWPDGSVHWIAAHGRASYGADGTPLSMDGVTIDFTDRRHLEESIERQTASLRDADRRKDEFLAVLGHELRNPLAPMRNTLELLRMRPGDREVVEKSAAVFGRQLAQITRLVDELLDVSRISSGKVRLEMEVVELGGLMREAFEAADPLMQSRRHSVTLEAPHTAVMVHVDRARMIQVFTNLLNNAAKYTDPGGTIAFVSRVHDRRVEVSVIDNGIGIAPEVLPQVFELFSQADSGLTRAQGGLGLGLNVVRRLVELHGGAVTASSEGPGRGSRFTVVLNTLAATRVAAD